MSKTGGDPNIIAENVAAIAKQRAAAPRFTPGQQVAVVNRPGAPTGDDNLSYTGVVVKVEHTTDYGLVVTVRRDNGETKRIVGTKVRPLKSPRK